MDPKSGDRQGKNDGLAYGESLPEGGEDTPEGERGFIGDSFKKLRGKYNPSQDQAGGSSQPAGSGALGGFGTNLFNKVHGAVHGAGRQINHRLARRETHSHTHADSQCDHGTHENCDHRYLSFAPQRLGNSIKWYVDGCGYMWAVSRALEQATQSIWILDCMSNYIASTQV